MDFYSSKRNVEKPADVSVLEVLHESLADRELLSATSEVLIHARYNFLQTDLSLQGFGACGPRRGQNEVRMSWWDSEDLPDAESRERIEGMSQTGNGLVYGVGAGAYP